MDIPFPDKRFPRCRSPHLIETSVPPRLVTSFYLLINPTHDHLEGSTMSLDLDATPQCIRI